MDGTHNIPGYISLLRWTWSELCPFLRIYAEQNFIIAQSIINYELHLDINCFYRKKKKREKILKVRLHVNSLSIIFLFMQWNSQNKLRYTITFNFFLTCVQRITTYVTNLIFLFYTM